jgi:hypothetical protein
MFYFLVLFSVVCFLLSVIGFLFSVFCCLFSVGGCLLSVVCWRFSVGGFILGGYWGDGFGGGV